jgi:hypothetical protein
MKAPESAVMKLRHLNHLNSLAGQRCRDKKCLWQLNILIIGLCNQPGFQRCRNTARLDKAHSS